MAFAISGLPIDSFRPLFGLDDDALAARGILRRTADDNGRYPCRVTLDYAAPGQTLLLLNHEHQDADSPYRSTHAIFVSEAAAETRHLVDEVPEVLRNRIVALRAYDAAGMMADCELVQGDEIETAIERQFADPAVTYLHAHNAAAGCFAARIDRG